MVLIYSETSSPRLQYICHFIFKEQMGIGFTLTNNVEGFVSHDGPKINYSYRIMESHVFHLLNHNLLFEKGIKEQPISCIESNGYKAFFNTASGDFPFDIFAACFYLLSRYEEYLPFKQDMYGRYGHENSLAFKEGFLHLPVVNSWIQDFGKTLLRHYPALKIKYPAFQFLPTYDIDIAWSYKSKGLLRNLGGFIRSPSLERISVLTRFKNDPFDSYEFLHQLHERHQLKPIYFFLVATTQGRYDKNISPYSHRMWQLIKKHAKKYSVGLHPSWKSNDNIDIIRKEKKIIETAANVAITKSRQHYIKFSLPGTFENLVQAGITDDYSMGYGSTNGFRASVASSFLWYNLEKEAVRPLRIHPFCYMDANCMYEQRLTVEQSYDELLHYYNICRKINGVFCSIFHNNFLGTGKQFTGWRALYEQFTSQLPR